MNIKPLRKTTDKKIEVKRNIRRSPRGKTKRYSLDYKNIYGDRKPIKTKPSDNRATPKWLNEMFEDYFNPCPLNPKEPINYKSPFPSILVILNQRQNERGI